MDDIKFIQQDIGTNLENQGSTIQVAKENMEEANINVELATGELKKLLEKGEKRNKRLGYGVLISMILCVLLFMTIIGNPFSSDSDEDLGLPQQV